MILFFDNWILIFKSLDIWLFLLYNVGDVYREVIKSETEFNRSEV